MSESVNWFLLGLSGLPIGFRHQLTAPAGDSTQQGPGQGYYYLLPAGYWSDQTVFSRSTYGTT